MKTVKETASHYLSLGLNPVPVKGGSKIPNRESWGNLITEEELESIEWEEIGVATGMVSKNLEALDFDLKNADDPKEFLQQFRALAGDALVKKLVMQRTPSGGYHLIYRCDKIESSQKLAKNKEGAAILETRGHGGYIKCYPSEGYSMVQGSFDDIPFITAEERFQLFVSGRQLNQLLKKDTEKRLSDEERDYQSRFPEYDNDPQIGLDLLFEHGWKEFGRAAGWVNLTRPGKEISEGMSGGYNLDGKFLFVFSTSQDNFSTEKPYNNSAIFAELECGGNYKKAYAMLYEQGYGKDDEEEEGLLPTVDFLSDETEENTYLDQARKGEVSHGLVTGWPCLDEYMRLKRNSFNWGIGFDNVGKSNLALSLAVSSNLLHGWKWGIINPENKTPETRQTLIETVSGKSLTYFGDRDEEFYRYRKYTRTNFKVVANRKHYSIKDAIDMGKRLYEYEGIDGIFIDPYNFFEGSGEYGSDSNTLSKLRVFSENYCTVIVMGHPYTGATRDLLDKKSGYLNSPGKYDAQGGANFPYRVDDFFIAHRIINHPSEQIRRTLQLTMAKVKTVRTGGRVHDSGDYTKLIWEERDGFIGYWDDRGVNPIYNTMMARVGGKPKESSGMTTKVNNKSSLI